MERGSYRYGFNGKEKDIEGMGGRGSTYDYGFRIYNPQIAKFLSVDPLRDSYPWLTPYQFAENRPIVAIDIDGLEAHNTNGEVIDITNETVKKADAVENADAFKDKIEFTINQTTFKESAKRVSGLIMQDIRNANSPDLNNVYYSVTINQLPDGMTKDDLFNYIRINFSQFKTNGGSDFMAQSKEEEAKWRSDNPEGSVMRFEVKSQYYFNLEEMAVIASKVGKDYWIFSTVTTLDDAAHPVSGNRQFGLVSNPNNTFTFYTIGADRPYVFLDTFGQEAIFEGAHTLWNAVMTNVANYVNKKGGKAVSNGGASERVTWYWGYQMRK